MKIFRTILATTAAALLLTAGIALASGQSKCSKGAMAGCAKGGNASMAGCSMGRGKACCGAKASNTTAMIGDSADIKTCTYRPGAVALKGTVLCNHCDLHVTETCQTMFRTESGCVFTLAGEKAAELRKAAVGGKKLVRIKGTVAENGELDVAAFRVIRSLQGGSSAM